MLKKYTHTLYHKNTFGCIATVFLITACNLDFNNVISIFPHLIVSTSKFNEFNLPLVFKWSYSSSFFALPACLAVQTKISFILYLKKQSNNNNNKKTSVKRISFGKRFYLTLQFKIFV